MIRAYLALAASKQQPALPITPPSKKLPLPAAGGSTFEASNVASTSTIQNGECDNFERFYGSIEMAYELLNVFGHTLACIEILKAMRRLTQAGADSANGRESYLKASVALARQYLFLGKVTRAGTVVGQALNAVARPAAAISEDTRVRCLLVSAEYLCHTGFIEKSISRYGEAVELARGLPSASRGPTWQRAMDRCQFLELQALAAETFSAIQIVRGELTSAVAASIQSLRLALRAASSLAKLTEARKKEEAGMGASNHDDPFGPSPEPATSAVAPALSSAQTVQQQNPGSATRLVTSALAGLHWRVSKVRPRGRLCAKWR